MSNQYINEKKKFMKKMLSQMRNYKFDYLRDVLGAQNYLHPKHKMKKDENKREKDEKRNPQDEFKDEFLYKRGSLNAKWIFFTERPLSQRAFEVLDKITLAIQEEKNFLFLSFNLNSFTLNEDGKREKRKKALLLSIQKLISLSSSRLGIIFGFSLFHFLSTHLKENPVFHLKSQTKPQKSLKAYNIEEKARGSEKKAPHNNLKEDKRENQKNRKIEPLPSLEEISNFIKYENSLSKTYLFFNLPFIVTYSLEALSSPDFFSSSKWSSESSSSQINPNSSSFSKLKKENLDINLRKKTTWNQIQNFMLHL